VKEEEGLVSVAGGEVEGVMLKSIIITEVSDKGIEIRYGNNNGAHYEQRQTTRGKWRER
jgi:hypothetical protein